jgi:xanthine dehydrogenase accessory factor
MKTWPVISEALERDGVAALISVASVDGSAPREEGARIVLTGRGFHGTIGGGALEWKALAEAQARLARGRSVVMKSYALGPELGQCCGGKVKLLSEVFDRSQIEDIRILAAREEQGSFSVHAEILSDRVLRTPLSNSPPQGGRGHHPAGGTNVQNSLNSPPHLRGRAREGGLSFTETFGETARPLYLFGAGHVGRALVLALAPLPFAIRWIDPRPGAFPSAMPGNVTAVNAADPLAELNAASEGTFVLVMTHSHALDLAIVEKALRDERFPFVGVIGSASKRARFVRRLRDGGVNESRIASLACPIGIGAITSKMPAAIAISAAAQLIERDEYFKQAAAPSTQRRAQHG